MKVVGSSIVIFVAFMGSAVAADASYFFTAGESTIRQEVTFNTGELLSSFLVSPPDNEEVQELGTLFILDAPPWGCLESNQIQGPGDFQTILEGNGRFYDESPVSFAISEDLVAQIMPFVVIGGQRYFFNSELMTASLNGEALAKSDGQNFDLVLQGAQASFTLMAFPSGLGSVTVNPQATSYASGEVVQVSAVPSAGWTFEQWIVQGSPFAVQTDGSILVTINSNTKVVAKFTSPTPYDPDVNGDGDINALDLQLVVNAILSGVFK